jgi:hypothetical protein
MDERREHERINLKKQCLINHSGNVGEIIDLSMGGVSCWCVHGHLCTDATSRKVDIFCKGGQLWARGLPLKVLISESVSGTFLGNVPVRKCRALFADLREGQREQLENIILSHTTTLPR